MIAASLESMNRDIHSSVVDLYFPGVTRVVRIHESSHSFISCWFVFPRRY